MSGIKSKIIRHVMRQGNMVNNKGKNQSTESNTEMTQWLELEGKFSKIVIISLLFYVLKVKQRF